MLPDVDSTRSSSAPSPPAARRPRGDCLLRALQAASPDLPRVAHLVLHAADGELLRLLPLILAAAQHAAEARGRRAAFSNLVRVVRVRVMACRPVKLRFLMLAGLEAYKEFWGVRIVFRAEVYGGGKRALEDARCGEGAAAGSVAEWVGGVEDARRACAEVVRGLFDAATLGVVVRDRHRGLGRVRRSFVAEELVDVLVERKDLAERAEAVRVARRLVEAGRIRRVGRRREFADDKSLWVLEEVDDGFVCGGGMDEEEGYRRVEVVVGCDLVDLQSVGFWTDTVYLANPIEGRVFGYSAVVHPMAVATESDVGGAPDLVRDSSSCSDGELTSDEEAREGQQSLSATGGSGTGSGIFSGLPSGGTVDAGEDTGVVTSAKVVKVFSSIARPMIVELRRLGEGEEVGKEEADVAPTRLLVKEGDDLTQDMAVEVLFKVFNMAWRDVAESADDAPVALGYEVFPTAAKRGFMEVVPGLTSLEAFDWDAWVATSGRDAAAVRRMVKSSAGSYIGSYIVGAADRHQSNVQVAGASSQMLHLDFGYLLGAAPPIDGPQIAVYKTMEAAFRAVGAWERFVDECEAAFLTIRRAAPAVIRTAVLMFTKAGFPAQVVREYLSGPLSLNTRAASEGAAGAVVRRFVVKSSQHWRTKLKSYSHQKIDPAFYSALESGYAPAVLAMKIVDSKQQAALKRHARHSMRLSAVSVPSGLTASFEEE